ncbi:MAG TPA: hypothetical protein PKD18_20405 [Saprospiraceae bacterium]|nr:hypothetical protein [Saprospiraceae bacterium]HOY12517.1 hypothetical protein [Saprospiraceae bacterium]
MNSKKWVFSTMDVPFFDGRNPRLNSVGLEIDKKMTYLLNKNECFVAYLFQTRPLINGILLGCLPVDYELNNLFALGISNLFL